MSKPLQFSVRPADASQRIDVFLSAHLPALSRAFIQKLCKDNRVLINNVPCRVSDKLKLNSKVTVLYSPDEAGQIESIDLPIIYEDSDVVVINKPGGLLTHAKGSLTLEPSVASWLEPRLNSEFGPSNQNRRGIVHRLDRHTSGVMVCAKNLNAQAWLQKQFASRNVKKTYVAIVGGQVDPAAAIIDMPIERHPRMPSQFRVGAAGKKAITQYKTLKTSKLYSEIELMPQTGRTHQLRVHLKQLGHPIIGDNIYGDEKAKRMYLHAFRLELTLPNHSRRVFTAKLPPEFNKLLEDST